MNLAKKIIVAAALSGTVIVNGSGALQAADTSSELTMGPLYGISFDVGTKRAVSYFLTDNGQCKLVLTLADPPDWDGVPSLTAIRFEAAIFVGKVTHFKSSEGKALEFTCHEGAQAMSVKEIEQVAIDAVR